MNRTLLISVFLCCAGFSVSQSLISKDESPFQVLQARSTISKVLDRRLVILDILTWEDEISVRGGYAIIVHRSGRFLEFSGDTTIVLNSLKSGFLYYEQDSENQIDRYTRPALQEMLNSEPPTSSPTKIQRPDLVLIYPFPGQSYGAELCMWWKFDHGDLEIDPVRYENKSFMVEISNQDDVSLKKVIVRSNQTVLDLSEHLIADMINRVHIRLWELNEGEREEGYREVKMYLKVYTPTPCATGSAIEALQAGFELEQGQFLLEAGKFYRQATELSDLPVYEEMYSRFLLRKGD